MNYEAKYLETDLIIYTIREENLDIWLQEEYYFVGNFLIKAEENSFNVFPLLNDHYFGHYFTNILDKIIFSERKGD